MVSTLRSIFAALLLAAAGAPAVLAQSSGPFVLASASDTVERRLTIGSIEGTVLGSDSRDALPTATVAVWSLPDSALVTGTTADIDGRFTIERLSPGRYFVRASFVGYEPFETEPFTITSGNPRIELAAINLAPVAAMLEGVQVEAERAEVAFEVDRTVYNTRDNIAARGGNATDLLQNIPAIEVDVDGRISLRGNQNVGILINGKPAPARGDFLTTFLQQISADLIERVEVLPNPSAKFDPEGLAGMINIVLKQGSELGTSGGVVLSAELHFNRSTNGNFDDFTENLLSLDGADVAALREQSRDDLDVRENEWTAQVDWIRPLAGLKLETGYKGTARRGPGPHLVLHGGESIHPPEAHAGQGFAFAATRDWATWASTERVLHGGRNGALLRPERGGDSAVVTRFPDQRPPSWAVGVLPLRTRGQVAAYTDQAVLIPRIRS